MRLTAAEKHESIRLVEGSDLSVRRTLRELGVHRSTFYARYRRYQAVGAAGLVPRPAAPPGATGTVSRCGSGTASWRPPWPIR